MILDRFLERNFPEIKEKILFFSKKVKKFFRKVIKTSKDYFQIFLKNLNKEITRINKEYPVFIENCQLISMYTLAFISFSKWIKSVLRFYPGILKILIPFAEIAGDSPVFFFLAEPNYSFIFYTIFSQLLYRRKLLKFSVKIRFHMSHILLLEFLQMIAFEWICFFFFDADREIGKQMKPFLALVTGTHILSVYLIHMYSLIMGLRNKIPHYPRFLNILNIFVDSSLLWIGIVKKKKNI